MNAVNWLLCDPPYNVWSSHKDAKYICDFLSFDGITDAVELCERPVRPGAHRNLCCPEL